jgi:hypothetical protein
MRPLRVDRMVSLVWVVVLLVVSGCGTVDVRSTANSQVDFTQYRTFGFSSSSQPSDSGFFTPANRGRVQNAVRRQLEQRSYRLADSPDFLVTTFLITERKTYDKSNPQNETGSILEDVQKHYGLMNDESLGGRPIVQYTEGSLVVQVIDPRQHKLLWEGIASGVVNPRQTDKDVQARIEEAVSGMFAHFPQR